MFTSPGLFPKALLPPPHVDIVEDIPGEQRQQQHATRNNKAHAHSPYLWLGTVSVVAWAKPCQIKGLVRFGFNSGLIRRHCSPTIDEDDMRRCNNAGQSTATLILCMREFTVARRYPRLADTNNACWLRGALSQRTFHLLAIRAGLLPPCGLGIPSDRAVGIRCRDNRGCQAQGCKGREDHVFHRIFLQL
jgi:hypothetical protein